METFEKTTKKSGVAKWSLIIALFVLINLFFNYGISLFINTPTYQDFCGDRQTKSQFLDRESCLGDGGSWQEYPEDQLDINESKTVNGYCNQNYTCNKDYKKARDQHSLTVFIILIILGVVTLISGIILRSNYVVSTALVLAAVLDFVIASVRYWSSAEALLQFSILLVAIAVLIYISYKKFSDKNEE